MSVRFLKSTTKLRPSRSAAADRQVLSTSVVQGLTSLPSKTIFRSVGVSTMEILNIAQASFTQLKGNRAAKLLVARKTLQLMEKQEQVFKDLSRSVEVDFDS
jgi:hypothetical protein